MHHFAGHIARRVKLVFLLSLWFGRRPGYVPVFLRVRAELRGKPGAMQAPPVDADRID